MKIERLKIDKRELLMDRLVGRVFHLTTRAAYEEMQQIGNILNNQSECYPINTSSQNSYGRLHGCVCLFDLAFQFFIVIFSFQNDPLSGLLN